MKLCEITNVPITSQLTEVGWERVGRTAAVAGALGAAALGTSTSQAQSIPTSTTEPAQSTATAPYTFEHNGVTYQCAEPDATPPANAQVMRFPGFKLRIRGLGQYPAAVWKDKNVLLYKTLPVDTSQYR